MRGRAGIRESSRLLAGQSIVEECPPIASCRYEKGAVARVLCLLASSERNELRKT